MYQPPSYSLIFISLYQPSEFQSCWQHPYVIIKWRMSSFLSSYCTPCFWESSVLWKHSTGSPCMSSGPHSHTPSAGRRSEMEVVLSAPLLALVRAGLGRGSDKCGLCEQPGACCEHWHCWARPAVGTWATVSLSAARTPVWNEGRRLGGVWRCSLSSLRAPGRRCWGQGCRSLRPCRAALTFLLETLSAKKRKRRLDHLWKELTSLHVFIGGVLENANLQNKIQQFYACTHICFD